MGSLGKGSLLNLQHLIQSKPSSSEFRRDGAVMEEQGPKENQLSILRYWVLGSLKAGDPVRALSSVLFPQNPQSKPLYCGAITGVPARSSITLLSRAFWPPHVYQGYLLLFAPVRDSCLSPKHGKSATVEIPAC